jgi:hypothetical protein
MKTCPDHAISACYETRPSAIVEGGPSSRTVTLTIPDPPVCSTDNEVISDRVPFRHGLCLRLPPNGAEDNGQITVRRSWSPSGWTWNHVLTRPFGWVELWGFEPQTSCMPCKRSTN